MHTRTLDALWREVREAAANMRLDDGRPFSWGEDDEGMHDAAADDLLGWADDCEARLGCSGVATFRAALLDYICVKHDDSCPDMQARRMQLLALYGEA